MAPSKNGDICWCLEFHYVHAFHFTSNVLNVEMWPLFTKFESTRYNMICYLKLFKSTWNAFTHPLIQIYKIRIFTVCTTFFLYLNTNSTVVFFYNSSLRLVNIHGVIFCSENWWSRWKIGFRFGTEYRLSAVCSKSLVFMCFIACVKFVQYLIRHVRNDGCGVESFLTFHKKEQRKGGPRNMSGECST